MKVIVDCFKHLHDCHVIKLESLYLVGGIGFGNMSLQLFFSERDDKVKFCEAETSWFSGRSKSTGILMSGREVIVCGGLDNAENFAEDCRVEIPIKSCQLESGGGMINFKKKFNILKSRIF